MSSRNRRTQGNPDADMFTASNNAPDVPSLSEITHEIYGGDPNRGPLEGRLGKGINANPLPITDIYPDRRQPRRVIPSMVRDAWDGDMDNLFAAWERAIQRAGANANFDLADVIKTKIREMPPQEDIDLGDVSVHPIEASLVGIIDLAASIRRDGLLNPISVVPFNNVYMLETGERRWLAYHLLYQMTREKQWLKIPAQISGQFSVWRQASENTARNDLNAIGRARQFALLLMDIWQVDHDRKFQPITDFDHEQDYYAQVSDSKYYRVPYGMNDKLISAMGLIHRSGLSEFRAMLRLPHVAWTTADDLNWPRQTLYLLTQLPPGEAEVLVETALDAQADTLSIVQMALGQDSSVDDKAENKTHKEPFRMNTSVLESRPFVAGARKLGRAIDMGMRLRDNKREEALHEIEALRKWLDEAERVLKTYRAKR